MKLGDMVVLKQDTPEYLKMGLEKEKTLGGVFAEYKVDGKWKVLFFDKDNFLGEFMIPEEDLEDWDDPTKKIALSYDGETIPNYTVVELMNDKPEYNEDGAFKGMRGFVIEVWDRGGFEVDFSKDIENLIYTAVIGNDLRIVDELKF